MYVPNVKSTSEGPNQPAPNCLADWNQMDMRLRAIPFKKIRGGEVGKRIKFQGEGRSGN